MKLIRVHLRKHLAERTIEHSPAIYYIRFPRDVRPRIARIAYAAAGKTHLVHRTVRKELWYIVIVKPLVESC